MAVLASVASLYDGIMTVVANFVSYNDTIAILISRAHHVNLKTLSTFTQLLCLIFVSVDLGTVVTRMHCVNMHAHWVQGVVVNAASLTECFNMSKQN